jgi:hypothetical protein
MDSQKNPTGMSTDMTTMKRIAEETLASMFKDWSHKYPGYPGIVRSLCQGTTVLSMYTLMTLDFGDVSKFITRGPSPKGVDLYEANQYVDELKKGVYQ